MTLLTWKPEFSVGIASVDDEHRTMMMLINDVYRQLEATFSEADIDDGLSEIFNTISMHFALEERLMTDAGYAEYEAHKRDHEELLDQIRELMDSFFDDPIVGAKQLEEQLSTWFAGHFSSFDARLHGSLGH